MSHYTYETYGPEEGVPVFYMHNAPGDGGEAGLRWVTLNEVGVRVIAPLRPPYAGADAPDSWQVVDIAPVVESIADELKLGKFAVAGWSDGGPYALACGTLLQDRVAAVAVLASPSPDTIEDDATNAARQAAIVAMTTAVQADDQALVRSWSTAAPRSDRRFIDQVPIKRMFATSHGRVLEAGPDGWLADGRAIHADWGFDPYSIDTRHVDVRIVHGYDDRVVSGQAARDLSAITGSRVDMLGRHGHFSILERLPVVYKALAQVVQRAP